MANNVELAIISQLEYYFGDVNLPRDKFMKEQMKLDEGWITIEILLTFKRLAQLSEDEEIIAAAAEKATGDLLEVSEDKKRIRRSPKHPVPEFNEERRKEMVLRTAYVKGFPLEEELGSIIEFFKPHGPVDSCVRRHYTDRISKEHKFKGSCFIIFKDVETCKKFMDVEEVKYGDVVLIRKWQADYIEEKKKERDEHKTKSGSGNANKAEKQNGKKKMDFPKGAVLHFKGITDETEISREEIKEKIKEVGDVEVSFIDYRKGQESGHVRLPEENSAVEFMKKIEDSKLKVGDATLELRVLEGEEEEKYLEDTVLSISKRRQANRARGGFGGGYGKNRKRKCNSRDDGPTEKKSSA